MEDLVLSQEFLMVVFHKNLLFSSLITWKWSLSLRGKHSITMNLAGVKAGNGPNQQFILYWNILHNLYPTKFLRYDACLRPIKLKDQMVFPIYRMLNVMWKNLEMKIDIPQVWKEEILHIPPQSRSSRENIQQAKVVVRTSIGITLLTVPQKQKDQGQIPMIMV